MRHTLSYVIKSLIDWFVRPRSIGAVLIRFGVTLYAVAFASGFYFVLTFEASDNTVSVGNGSPTAAWIFGLAAILATILIVAGIALAVVEFMRASPKRVLVVEARGLRNADGKPLHESIPAKIRGKRDSLLIDVRQGVKDGEIFSPDAAAETIRECVSEIHRRTGRTSGDDVTLVYGGLTPVPLTFLTGVLLDDEDDVLIFDWDRHRKVWRALDEDDDNQRFEVSGMEDVQKAPTDVVVAVTV
jgi:hypothetical protein